jgi:hypothetical protein
MRKKKTPLFTAAKDLQCILQMFAIGVLIKKEFILQMFVVKESQITRQI